MHVSCHSDVFNRKGWREIMGKGLKFPHPCSLIELTSLAPRRDDSRHMPYRTKHMSLAAFVKTALIALPLMIAASPASASDSHAGYYYPEPNTREVYVSPLDPIPTADRRSRIGLTVGLNAQQLKRGYTPGYHIFAKGAEGEKLIIVATGPDKYDTLYRMRGLLAALTAQARTSPLFQNMQTPEDLNFLDLCRMAGFVQVTVSDGDKFAHRINLR